MRIRAREIERESDGENVRESERLGDGKSRSVLTDELVLLSSLE